MRECPGTRDRLQAEPGSILTKPDQGRQVRRREPERVQHPDLVIRVLKVTKQWWPPEAEMEALISRISLTFFPTRIQGNFFENIYALFATFKCMYSGGKNKPDTCHFKE